MALTECTVRFKVTGIPDSAGIRIKTLEPFGFYLSLADPRAAQYWFELCIAEFIIKTKHIDPCSRGIGNAGRLPWEEIMREGIGEIFFKTITQEEMEETYEVGDIVILHDFPEPTQNFFAGPEGMLLIVRDDTKLIDRWLLDEVRADILARRPQN